MKNEILISLRKRKNLTQKELAKKVNVSVSTIGMMESGERVGSIEVLGKIADFFGVTIDYLQGKSTEPTIETREDLVAGLLKFLIETGVIKDENNIDNTTQEMIMNMVRKEVALIKAKKGEK
ncbi:MAG: helix-turn-helix domain-containing protein [Clostridiaceae bacterium]